MCVYVFVCVFCDNITADKGGGVLATLAILYIIYIDICDSVKKN